MGYKEAKFIRIKVLSVYQDYVIYDEKDEKGEEQFYYMRRADYDIRDQSKHNKAEKVDLKLEENDKAWVKDVSKKGEPPQALLTKIEQDKQKKLGLLFESIKKRKERLDKSANAIIVLQRAFKNFREKKKTNQRSLTPESVQHHSNSDAEFYSAQEPGFGSISTQNEGDDYKSTNSRPDITQTQQAKKEIYQELQAIMELLKALKGTEPQVNAVRDALNAAIEHTGVTDNTQPQDLPVQTQGAASSESSPVAAEPPVDEDINSVQNIQKNIDLLLNIKDKIAGLMSKHADVLQDDEQLQKALTELSTTVDESIQAARNILNTKEKKESVRQPTRHDASPSSVPDDENTNDSPLTP